MHAEWHGVNVPNAQAARGGPKVYRAAATLQGGTRREFAIAGRARGWGGRRGSTVGRATRCAKHEAVNPAPLLQSTSRGPAPGRASAAPRPRLGRASAVGKGGSTLLQGRAARQALPGRAQLPQTGHDRSARDATTAQPVKALPGTRMKLTQTHSADAI